MERLTRLVTAARSVPLGPALAAIAGANPTTYEALPTEEDLRTLAKNQSKIVTFGTKPVLNGGQQPKLIGGHAYAITGYIDNSMTFLVRNPHGNFVDCTYMELFDAFSSLASVSF